MDNVLIGKTITAVYIAEDKYAIRFDVEGSDSIVVKTDGDCCSTTWIENIDGAEQLLSEVVSVEDIPMPKLTECEDEWGEVIAYYGCKITTLKGFAVIDFRNSSNGYYGGDLRWPGEMDYYGGVFNQNDSEEVWKKVDPNE